MADREKPEQKSETIETSVRMPHQLYVALAEIARKEGKSTAFVIRRACAAEARRSRP